MFWHSKGFIFICSAIESIREGIQWGGNWKGNKNGFSLWVVFDIARIITMWGCYIAEEIDQDGLNDWFAFMILFSWLSTIKYLRIFKKIRALIDLLGSVVRDMMPFISILGIGFFAVTNAFWAKINME